jgi:hypothetical protein
MATLLHRTTKQLLVSVDPNGLPEPIANYIEDPDLSAVTGEPNKYWIITGDVVTLMDQAAQDAVDAAELAAREAQSRTISVDAVAEPLTNNALTGHQMRAIIELFNKRDNFNTTRIIELQNQVQAMIGSTGNIANLRADGAAVAISATSTRTRPEAITDYNDIINSGGVDT